MIISLAYMVVWLSGSDWGFFGHRLINRVAVYTVPTEMMGWYKPYIDYITEHAVDPDKRRYATKHEAVRHYIDLDHWGTWPFEHMPRYWDQALALNLELYSVEGTDTLVVLSPIPVEQWGDTISDMASRLKLVRGYYLRQYYDDVASVACDTVQSLFPQLSCHPNGVIYMRDVISEHGIVPYHLQAMQRRLTSAFRANDLEQVLRTSAEIGHYIADACVPLHTTSNYNGQLTNQVGIHAFWESRIPELFAIDEFDMVVGGAEYMDDPVSYFWNLVLTSHKEVERVLSIEQNLRSTYPSDKQFCYEDRLNQNVRTQCEGFAQAYNLAMNNMVEDRFRVAVKAVGDAWYTAWIDAGQPAPPANRLINPNTPEDEELAKAVKSGKALGREHEN